MLVNKWLQFAMAAASVLGVGATQLPWGSVVSSGTAASISGGLMTVLAILKIFQPGVGQSVSATGGTLITHK